MNHLTYEELILMYYREPDLGSRSEHASSCDHCRAELAALALVLDRVQPGEAPEPPPDYEARVWDRLQWRLRSERRNQRRPWRSWAAVAAIVATAFVSGLLLNRGTTDIEAPPRATALQQTPGAEDRILFVVVGDHFAQSERVLVELTNLDATASNDMTVERDRARNLLASNRLYRRTATERGEEQVATLLDELEPVLLQIAHADELDPDELRAIQKRVESKGLVFKLRVVRASVSQDAADAVDQHNHQTGI